LSVIVGEIPISGSWSQVAAARVGTDKLSENELGRKYMHDYPVASFLGRRLIHDMLFVIFLTVDLIKVAKQGCISSAINLLTSIQVRLYIKIIFQFQWKEQGGKEHVTSYALCLINGTCSCLAVTQCPCV